MANSRFQRGLRYTKQGGMAEHNEVADQVRKFASRLVTAYVITWRHGLVDWVA